MKQRLVVSWKFCWWISNDQMMMIPVLWRKNNLNKHLWKFCECDWYCIMFYTLNVLHLEEDFDNIKSKLLHFRWWLDVLYFEMLQLKVLRWFLGAISLLLWTADLNTSHSYSVLFVDVISAFTIYIMDLWIIVSILCNHSRHRFWNLSRCMVS